MSEPLGLELTSWNEFVGYVDSFVDVARPTQTAYLFRGVPSNQYRLEPSLLRLLRQPNVSVELAHQVEQRALGEFQRRAHLYLGQTADLDSRGVLAWWALMQHHGAPTRLLDWTRSPFVAAYFAVEKQPERPGVIWVAHIDTARTYARETYPQASLVMGDRWESSKFQDPSAAKILNFVRNPRETDRMAAQQGFFSLSPQILADHQDILDGAARRTKDPEKRFFVMTVPTKLKPEFRRHLWHLNVSAQTLFPGIDGLGRSITELVQLETESGR